MCSFSVKLNEEYSMRNSFLIPQQVLVTLVCQLSLPFLTYDEHIPNNNKQKI